MNEFKHGTRFWVGNTILAVALLSLFFMGPLSQRMGVWAMVLWMILAGVGMYFLVTDKSEPPPGMPD